MYSYKIYPNLEFSIGRKPFERRKKTHAEAQYDDLSHDYTDFVPHDGKPVRRSRVLQEVKSNDRSYRFIKPSELRPNLSSPMNKRHHGIRPTACRNIRNLIYCLNLRHKAIGFYTLTLPHLDDLSLRKVQDDWGVIVNKLFRNLRKIYKKRFGTNLDYVYVCEIQEKRSAREGRSVPHIHFAMPAKIGTCTDFWVSADRLRMLWCNIISRYLDGQESVDFGASCDCQLVRSNLSAYFSKYLSKCKSKSVESALESDISLWHISRYWGKSADLGASMRDSILRHDSDDSIAGRLLFISASSCKEYLHYSFRVCVEHPIYGTRVWGYSGCLTESGYEWLVNN